MGLLKTFVILTVVILIAVIALGAVHAAPLSAPRAPVHPGGATLGATASNACANAASCPSQVLVPAGSPDLLFAVVTVGGTATVGVSASPSGPSYTASAHVLISNGAANGLYLYLLKNAPAGLMNVWANDSTGYVGLNLAVFSGLAASPFDTETVNHTSFVTFGASNAPLTSTQPNDLGVVLLGTLTAAVEYYNASAPAYVAYGTSTPNGDGTFTDSAFMALNLAAAGAYSGATGLGYGQSPIHGALWMAFTLFTASAPAPVSAVLAPTTNSTLLGTPAVLALHLSDGTPPYTWTLEVNGSASNLTGAVAVNAPFDYTYTVPAVHAATYVLYLNVTDSALGTNAAVATVTVEPILSAFLGASALVTDVGVASTLSVSFLGGVAPFAWTLAESGSALNLSGVVGGLYAYTPVGVGSKTFYLNATDAAAEVSKVTVSVTAVSYPTATLTRAPVSLVVGQSSHVTLTLAGGTGRFVWTLTKNGSASNLTGAVAGVYEFTPTHAGTYTFYLNATDGVGGHVSKTATVTVTSGGGGGGGGGGPTPAPTWEIYAVWLAIAATVLFLASAVIYEVRGRW